MKNNRICPKCGSADILKINGSVGAYGVGNNIQVGKTIFSAVLIDRYVCGHCGFSEEYIEPKDIPALKNHLAKEKIKEDKKKKL